MKNRSSILVILILSFASSLASLAVCFSNSTRYLCKPSEFEGIFNFLFLFGSAFFIISLALLFIKSGNVSRIWKKFIIFYMPIALILIGISPTTNMQFIGFDKEITTMWTAGIFFIASIIIILGKRE